MESICTQKSADAQQGAGRPCRADSQHRQAASVFMAAGGCDAEGNEAIYAAVSRVSNTMASMPLHLYKGYERQDAHPLERLVAFEPNVNFTPFSFIRTMEVLRNTEGNCYALIVPDKLGQPMRLDILNPCFVKPYKHTETKEIWYSITLDDGKSYQVPGCTLIALQHMSANGVDGIRPLDVLCGSLDYDRTVKELALNQLEA